MEEAKPGARVASCVRGALLLASLVLAGCAQPAGREVGPLVGNLAPGFEVQPASGEPAFNLSAHRGSVVLLDLMGVNCPPCREEMPHLLAVSASHANDSRFAMLSVDMASVYPGLGARNEEEIRGFRAEFNATWPFAPDSPRGEVGRGFEPIAIPTLVIIDPEGVIRFKAGGGVIGQERIEAEIARAREAP